MIDFIELFNSVARVARPAHHDFTPINSLEERFVDTCFDSLDMLMIGMFMCIIYDIDDEVGKNMQVTTVQEMFNFIQKNKKRDPESIEWAMELIK